MSEIYTDSKLCRKRFIVRTATNEANKVGERGNIVQAMVAMMAQKRTNPMIPHSTSCWIYQLSGM
jgi:hypothetical protein